MSEQSASVNKALRKAADALAEAEALLITTGAGMGVDSGLATYRGRNAGVWPPMGALGLDMSDLSTPRWFEVDPHLAWSFWRFRIEMYMRKSEPHEGYRILADWGESLPYGFFSVTSNIDGHWGRIIDESLIWEVHGAVTHSQLVDDDGRIWETDIEQILELPTFEWDLEPGDRVKVREATTGRSRGLRSPLVDATVAGDGSCLLDDEGHTIIASEVYQTDDGPDLIRIPPGAELPCCPATGKPVRPNVLMFNDYGINLDRNERQEREFRRFESTLPRECRLVIVEIGAGHAVPTIRMRSEETAHRFPSSVLIRINLDDDEFPRALRRQGIALPLGALEALELLRNAVEAKRSHHGPNQSKKKSRKTKKK